MRWRIDEYRAEATLAGHVFRIVGVLGRWSVSRNGKVSKRGMRSLSEAKRYAKELAEACEEQAAALRG